MSSNRSGNFSTYTRNMQILTFKKRNFRKRCETCWKLIKTQEQNQWHRSSVFIFYWGCHSQSFYKIIVLNTAWKVSKCGVFPGSYLIVFGPNTEIYGVTRKKFPHVIAPARLSGMKKSFNTCLQRKIKKKVVHVVQEVQLQWTPPAFKSQRGGHQSYQKLLHHYQH